MIAARQFELKLTALGIGNLACGGLQPAIRLPNGVNFHSAQLRLIEEHSKRSDHKGQRKLREAFRELVGNLDREIHKSIKAILSSHSGSITFVSDAPLEWLSFDGLPLMIKNEVSRIGMTPGNLLLTECIDSGTLSIRAEDLHEIIVIRSFGDNDPIRNMLQIAIETFRLTRVRVKIVDAKTLDEVTDALNAFKGVIVVFDCHGGHNGDEGNGWLLIGNQKVDAWKLAHVARVPPIVILSACSTFALAGSHASVGNGLIRSGALTVVGTLLPVDAAKSATFVARLLYRIDAFLPALAQLEVDLISWRFLVSTFLRMTYVTDILRFFLETKAWLTEAEYEEIGILTNNDINSLHDDWHGRFISRIAQNCGRPAIDISSTIASECPLVETLLYCQIGRPELLLIHLSSDNLTDVDVDRPPKAFFESFKRS